MASTAPRTPPEDFEIHEFLGALEPLHPLLIGCDIDSRLMWMSDACGKLCASPTTYLGGGLEPFFAALCDTPDHSRINEACTRLERFLGTEQNSMEFRFDLGTNRGKPSRVNLIALRCAGRAPKSIAIVILQLDDQAGASVSARPHSEDDLKATLEFFPDAALALDQLGFLVSANDAAANLFKVESQSLKGRAADVFRPYSEELADALTRLRQEDVTHQEVRITRADGEPAWISFSTRSLDIEAGVRVSRLVWMRNIDDDVIRRSGMERRNAQLEDLVYSASHGLRSPLLSVLGFTQLLRKDFDHLLDETGRHFTDRIERSARTMDELIEDLLSLCQIRIDENQRATVDSRSLLLRLESDLKARLEDRDIELRIPESCPPLFGDRNRLYQLVSHLMVNAIEHMGECEIRRIEITVEKLNDDRVLSVRDWGQGIPPGDLEKVFVAFYSKATSASGEKSRGLGLAIVRKIADVHGGRAWAETPIGSGACFRVMLPSR